jgi:hypothetical protein
MVNKVKSMVKWILSFLPLAVKRPTQQVINENTNGDISATFYGSYKTQNSAGYRKVFYDRW